MSHSLTLPLIGRGWICGFLMLSLSGECITRGAEPAVSLKSFRSCASALQSKAQLQLARDSSARLHEFQHLVLALQQGGLISSAQTGEVKEEILRQKIYILQIQTQCENELDRFESRQGNGNQGQKQIQQVERLLFQPLFHHFRLDRQIEKEYRDTLHKAQKLQDNQKKAQVREQFKAIIVDSKLIQRAELQKYLQEKWKVWEKLSDQGMQERRRTIRDKRRETLEKVISLEAGRKPVPDSLTETLDNLSRDLTTGWFERDLRHLEKRFSPGVLSAAVQSFNLILMEVRSLCLTQIQKNWPRWPTLKLKGTDLLSCDLEKGMTVVRKSLENLKEPEARMKGRAHYRKFRELSKIYRIRQQLVQQTQFSYRSSIDDLNAPPMPGARLDLSATIRRVLKVHRELAQEKRRMLLTWADGLRIYGELTTLLGIPFRLPN